MAYVQKVDPRALIRANDAEDATTAASIVGTYGARYDFDKTDYLEVKGLDSARTITLTAKNGAGSAAPLLGVGVNLILTTQAATVAAGVGGAITLTATAGFTSGAGGAITLTGGGGGATGAGGALVLSAGAGGATSGAGGNITLSAGTVTSGTAGIIRLAQNVSTPAGGSAGAQIQLGATALFGIYFGSGAPTVTAAQGSLYFRSDGSSTSTRLYVNTTGSTTWTNVTTAA